MLNNRILALTCKLNGNAYAPLRGRCVGTMAKYRHLGSEPAAERNACLGIHAWELQPNIGVWDHNGGKPAGGYKYNDGSRVILQHYPIWENGG